MTDETISKEEWESVLILMGKGLPGQEKYLALSKKLALLSKVKEQPLQLALVKETLGKEGIDLDRFCSLLRDLRSQ